MKGVTMLGQMKPIAGPLGTWLHCSVINGILQQKIILLGETNMTEARMKQSF